jgi:hypothetical protein
MTGGRWVEENDNIFMGWQRLYGSVIFLDVIVR